MRASQKMPRPGWLAKLLVWLRIRCGGLNEQKYRDNGWDSYAEKIECRLRALWLGWFSRKQLASLDQTVREVRSSRIFNHQHLVWEQDSARPLIGAVTFKHSGNAGDIIYALPAIKALSQGRPAKLFLKLDAPINGWSAAEHPLGKSGLTAGMVSQLKPLLAQQNWLTAVEIHNGEAVDYDLDLFREIPNIHSERGSITHWYFWLFAVNADLSQPWLEVGAPPVSGNKIVLARSTRYRNPGINYACLHELGEIDFVGTRAEFLEMQAVLPELRHAECSDFLQLARVIRSARFFIGNQSFPYAVAEALKVPRILEVYPPCPNVTPTGVQAGAAFFQSNFEKLVRRFWEETRQNFSSNSRGSGA